MPVCGCEVTLLAGEKRDTAAAFIIANETRMYGCLTYKRVTAIDGVRDSGVFFKSVWTSNHKGLIIDLLITYCMWVQYLHSLAISRTSESEGGIVKRATSISVQTTAVAGIPTAISIEHPKI